MAAAHSRVSHRLRKDKKQLTMIPDGERAVTSRFNIILVGGACRDFASMMVSSELAQAYCPHQGGRQLNIMPSLQEDVFSPSPSNGSEFSKTSHSPEGDDERLVMYCPLDAGSTGSAGERFARTSSPGDLARLLFTPLVKFSDAMPIPRGHQAEKTVVVLLFWRVPEIAGSEADTCTSSVISDFITRMAEVRFVQMQFRPYVSLLAFGANEEQETHLQHFLSTQADLPKKVQVSSSFVEDDGEDFVMSELQTVCANAALWDPEQAAAAMMETDPPPAAVEGKARSCAIL